jgi:site-specific DNA-cytosine methylase
VASVCLQVRTADLANSTAINLKTMELEFVESCSESWCGWPCKDMSMLGPNRARFVGSLADPLGKGGVSATVYKEVLAYVKRYKPAVFVMENVQGSDVTVCSCEIVFGNRLRERERERV